MIANDTTANPEDHGAMTTDKGVKGRFIVLFDEGRQQLPIRPARRILPKHGSAKTPNHRVQLSRRHSCPPWPIASAPYS
jgi:hypothetical protein